MLTLYVNTNVSHKTKDLSDEPVMLGASHTVSSTYSEIFLYIYLHELYICSSV